MDMRIAELGRATGVDIETIRYYEKAGLLPTPARTANGYRDYGPTHLERLAFVRHCRALDMPLAEVKRLLDFIAHPASDCSPTPATPTAAAGSWPTGSSARWSRPG